MPFFIQKDNLHRLFDSSKKIVYNNVFRNSLKKKVMAQYLPSDILREILEHFINDVVNLHSFLLVNRLWCSNAVVILWKRPFNITKSHKIILTYISCLDHNEKLRLKTSDLPLPVNPPTYNYPSFLRHLSYFPFISFVKLFCINHKTFNPCEIEQILFRLFSKSTDGLEILDFIIDIDDNLNLFDNFTAKRNLFKCESIINWMSHIKEIELGGDFVIDENFISLLTNFKDLKKVSKNFFLNVKAFYSFIYSIFSY